MTDPTLPLVIQTTDPDLRVHNPEVLSGRGIVILPPGVTWHPFVITAPPTYDEPASTPTLIHAYVPGDVQLPDTPITVCERKMRPGVLAVVISGPGIFLTDCTEVTCEDCRRRATDRPAEAARNGLTASAPGTMLAGGPLGCGNTDGPDGVLCARPADHDGDHSTYDPSTGFSRHWDTIHVPGRPLVHGVRDLTTDDHGRVRSLCSLAMRPDDTYVLVGRSAIFTPADVTCPNCTTISAHEVAP